MAAATDELLEIVLDIDWDKEPECESPHHLSEPHFHGGPVTHLVRGLRCGHIHGLRCANWVAAVQAYGGSLCPDCGVWWPIKQIRFIEL